MHLELPWDENPIVRTWHLVCGVTRLRLYGVRMGRDVRARRVTVLNRGTIVLGDRVAIWSFPDGTPYPASLRAYDRDSRIEIGEDSRIAGAIFHCNDAIIVGPHARIGPGTILCDNDSHPPRRTIEGRSGAAVSAPIRLERHVWLGMRVTVAKGVTIGENTIVAPGSVVTRSLPPNVLAGGVPAKPIRELQ